MRAFKTFSARRINTLHRTPGIPVWQRNYYEHIIRDEDDLENTRRYILDNPLAWETEHSSPPAAGHALAGWPAMTAAAKAAAQFM